MLSKGRARQQILVNNTRTYRGREERLIQKQDQDKRPRWIKSHGAPCVTLTLTRESALDWPTDAHRGLTRIKVGFSCNFSFPFPLPHFANPLRRSLSHPHPPFVLPSFSANNEIDRCQSARPGVGQKNAKGDHKRGVWSEGIGQSSIHPPFSVSSVHISFAFDRGSWG